MVAGGLVGGEGEVDKADIRAKVAFSEPMVREIHDGIAEVGPGVKGDAGWDAGAFEHIGPRSEGEAGPEGDGGIFHQRSEFITDVSNHTGDVEADSLELDAVDTGGLAKMEDPLEASIEILVKLFLHALEVDGIASRDHIRNAASYAKKFDERIPARIGFPGVVGFESSEEDSHGITVLEGEIEMENSWYLEIGGDACLTGKGGWNIASQGCRMRASNRSSEPPFEANPMRWPCQSLTLGLFTLLVVASPLGARVWSQSVFPDKALEAAVRAEVFAKRYNQEPITADDVKQISQVVAKGKGITNLEGMQHCKAIALIDLENNQIHDLGPLKELNHVQSLNLAGNQIESISALEAQVQMQYLELSRNQIEDLTPLRKMANMRSLYLSENRIANLSAVAELPKVGTLYVAKNPISDWSPIGKLKWLHSLDASHCKIQSLEFLKPLRQLSYLMLVNNEIQDLAPLADMCEVEKDELNRFAPFLQLYIQGNKIPDEDPQLNRLREYGVRLRHLGKG